MAPLMPPAPTPTPLAPQLLPSAADAPARASFSDERSGLAPLESAEFDARHSARLAELPKDRLDVWMEGTYGQFEVDKSEGEFGILHIGADYLYTPDVLIGFSAQIDWIDSQSTEDESTAEGLGFLVGPYVTARLAPKLLFDGRVSWGQARNEISPFGTYSDEFDSERWLISAAFIGDFKLNENLTLMPEARLNWYREESDAYVDSHKLEIDSVTVETGSLEFGPTVRGTFKSGEQGSFNPFVGLKGIWTFANNISTEEVAENPPQAEEGIRGKIDFGIEITDPELAEGLMISLSGFYDGFGEEDFEVWGGNIGVRKSF
ncbi:MAG: autotransporter outer membrane beta-barrel domain-containing protein [Rhizobiaceae bacterium]